MPLNYGMCRQTVTVYRKNAQEIQRFELPGCFLQWQQEQSFERLGQRQERKFLLIQPGKEQLVFPGDRVFEGIGPHITAEDWAAFTPEQVAGLGQIAYAVPYRWQGAFCHTEAGRK